MPMRPGTAPNLLADTLTDAIDGAMQAEWAAVKNEALPASGALDRRILFAAIAQGVVDFLKDHEADFAVTLGGTVPTGLTVNFKLAAPKLTLTGSGSTGTAGGEGFDGATSVTLRWDDPPQTLGGAVPVSGGAFSGRAFTVPALAPAGRHVVSAHDDQGGAALAFWTV